MFCPHCGTPSDENNYKCLKCAGILHPTAPIQVQTDNTMGGFIPYKNMCGLLAYYFGVFSLIPFLGIPLAIAAIVLGVIGLRHAAAHPEARGKAHAWTGIILGGFMSLAYIVFVIVLIVAAIHKR
jgi:hypothetical protein